MSEHEKPAEKRRKRPGRPRFLRTYEWVVVRPMRLHGRKELLMPGTLLPKAGEAGSITPWRLRGLYRHGRIAEAGGEYADWLLAEWERRGGPKAEEPKAEKKAKPANGKSKKPANGKKKASKKPANGKKKKKKSKAKKARTEPAAEE